MTAPQPVRLQLSRRKGFNIQALSLATNGLPALKATQARLKAQDRRLERREWLMGFPIDHTACDASEIRLYLKSPKSLPAPSTSK
ncbi:MAG TPA: hypothetical protein VMQ76_10840 [Terracidiphilus sp.]|nr:hypothetical protein [Terracidiphilus sp.]